MTDYTVDADDPMPRYYQVYHSLLERIRSGEFDRGEALPPERQLTGDYGVSRITIVKALDMLEQDSVIDRQHGRGTFVTGLETKEQQKTFSIAFLPGVFDHPYLFNVLMGIAHGATQEHCHLQVMGAYENSQEEIHYVNEAITRGVDGLLVYPRPGYDNVALYRHLVDKDFPLVMVDRYYPQVLTDRVTFNDSEAGHRLTALLLDQGHSRIAVLPHYEIDVTSVRDRLSGYRRALKERGIAYDETMIWLDVYGTFDPLHDRNTSDLMFARRLLARLEQDRPTALLAINQDIAERILYDLMMIRTDRMRAAIESNAQFTDYDLELASFSHVPRTNYTPLPSIVAVQSGEELGKQAAELLIGRLNGTVTGAAQTRTVPMQIAPSVPEASN